MDALDLLTSDHDEVKELFERFGEAGEAAKPGIAAEIIEHLRIHTTIEEEIFYPAVREAVPAAAELLDESVEEHHVVEQLMAEIETVPPSEDAWAAKVTVMEENVEHHVEEEESELFPQVRAALDTASLAKLGGRLEVRKHELMYDGMTRDDLYGLARERGISGRSDMTKVEIVEALVEADRAGVTA